MDLTRFTDHLQTYGADLARWPEDHRRAAQTLLDHSPAAREARDAAQRLERLFLEDRPIVSDARRHAITSAAIRQIRTAPAPVERSWRWLISPFPGAAFATMLAMGIFVGLALPPEVGGQSQPQSQLGLNSLIDYPASGVEGLIQ